MMERETRVGAGPGPARGKGLRHGAWMELGWEKGAGRYWKGCLKSALDEIEG